MEGALEGQDAELGRAGSLVLQHTLHLLLREVSATVALLVHIPAKRDLLFLEYKHKFKNIT